MNQSMSENLSKEQCFVVLMSRLSFNDNEIDNIHDLVKSEMDWFEILQYSLSNKVLGLVYLNITKFKLIKYMNLLVYQNMKFYYMGTKIRNESYLKEHKKLMDDYRKNNVECIPLKGAWLIANMYKDYGIRSINDLDYLIRYQDIDQIDNLMKRNGFYTGKYDRDTKEIKINSRKKEIAWKLKMNNVPTYVKKAESLAVESYDIDFSFSLNLDKRLEPVEEMILQSNNGYLKPAHFFVHLCCHLHKEATGAIWILHESDLNLIKFCDVREYVIQHMNREDIQEAIQFSNHFGLSNSIYYTVFFLKEIYEDGYEDEILTSVETSDATQLDSFGESDFDSRKVWSKSFWERVFATSNRDQLLSESEFCENYKKYKSF